MPVTIIPGEHQPKVHPNIEPAETVTKFLEHSCPAECVPGQTQIFASSFYRQERLQPSSSSFVRSAIEAWGRHSHLVLRPEDIFFTILTQMNFFMTKNAESLRHLFVAHKDKKSLHVSDDSWESIIPRFREKIQENIKTPWLSEWISPGFSTSTYDDEVTATVLMMGMMKAYFDYSGDEVCGIPSITLRGTKEDWQRLAQKAERLKDFGDEPARYAERISPILSRFVRTFDDSAAADIRDFWDSMVHAKVKHSNICGFPPKTYVLSGWILGFFFWDAEGNLRRRLEECFYGSKTGPYELDGVKYGEAVLEDIPIGYAKANFTMVGCGVPGYKAWILAGNIGKNIYHGLPKDRALVEKIEEHHGDSGDRKAQQTPAIRKERRGSFARLLCGINCFSSQKGSENDLSEKQSSPAPQPASVSEKNQVLGDLPSWTADTHTTIEPTSGWFLFGPEQDDLGPFLDSEELSGPTVDAIESCEGVQHTDDDGEELFS